MQRNDLICVSQKLEIPIQSIHKDHFAYRYAYARSMEMQEAESIGQDYIASLTIDSALIFAVCDGVSESFMGNLAAQYLGDALVKWLKSELKTEIAVDEFQDALSHYLLALTEDATETVQQYLLPEDIPDILRQVLEQKRSQGSQTTFVCGRIDLPSARIPQGRVALSWMGDSRLRVWKEDGSPVALEGVFRTRQRWSTDRGPINGHPNVYLSNLRGETNPVQCIMAYTDGLSSLDAWDHSPPSIIINQLIEDAGQKPQSDDIAFFEVWLGDIPPSWSQEVVQLPAPQIFDFVRKGSSLRLAWRTVPEATRYEIMYNQEQVFAQATSWETSISSPGTYRVRLRAWQNKVPGKWSESQEVTISGADVQDQLKDMVPNPSFRYARLVVMGALTLIAMYVMMFAFLPGGILHNWLISNPTATTSPTVMDSPSSSTPISTSMPALATSTFSSPVSILTPTLNLTPTATTMSTETSTPGLLMSPTGTFTSPTETPATALPTLLSPLSTPTSTVILTSNVTPQP